MNERTEQQQWRRDLEATVVTMPPPKDESYSQEVIKLITGMRRRRSSVVQRDALSEAFSHGLIEYGDEGFALTSKGEAVADRLKS